MAQNKYPQNLHTPKNVYFSENPQKIEIQNFEPKKMTRAYVCMKISENPPGIISFSAGDHKTSINRRARKYNKNKTEKT